MRPDFPGGLPPGGRGPYDCGPHGYGARGRGRGRRRRGEPLEPYERLITYSSDGGRRRRKKNGFLKHVWDVLLWTVVGLLIFLAVEAMPYLLKFESGDTMRYSDASIFGKADALRDGLRHKREISEVKFSHDGKKVTLTYEKGTLTDVSGEGYGEGDEGEWKRDADEARRLLKEWGVDQ